MISEFDALRIRKFNAQLFQMKKIIAGLILILSVSFAKAQTDQDSAWIMDHYTKQEFTIPMRDGVKLFTFF